MSSERSTAAGCSGGLPAPARSLQAVVEAYIRDHRCREGTDLRFFATQPSLQEAVQRAALCKRPDGKRYNHQRRQPPAALEEASHRLLTADFEGVRSFDDLHDAISQHIDDIPMVGELTIYDIACRIGAFLKLEPTKVYLHAGTRSGAVALGIDRRRQTVELSELPRAFRVLTAAECEDCLCIYKDQIAAAVRGEATDLPRARACDGTPVGNATRRNQGAC